MVTMMMVTIGGGGGDDSDDDPQNSKPIKTKGNPTHRSKAPTPWELI
jgi:hypothetical protein